MVDLDRAFQTFQDAGIEVPIVTTSFTSPSDTYAYAVLYVCGQIGGAFCRLGEWPPASDPARAKFCDAGDDGSQYSRAIRRSRARNATSHRCWRIMRGVIRGGAFRRQKRCWPVSGRTALGYCFDPAQAVIEARSANGLGGGSAGRNAAARRRRAFRCGACDQRSRGHVKPAMSPGRGRNRLEEIFRRSRCRAAFADLISLHMDYAARNPVSAMKKDLAFVRARVDEAWKAGRGRCEAVLS